MPQCCFEVIFVGSLVTFATLLTQRLSGKFLARKIALNLMYGNLLENFSLFEGFSAGEKDCLRPLFLFSYVPEGTTLFDQGDPAEHFYIVADGEIIIRYKPDDGPTLVLTRVHKEGVVGWSAAIGSPTYTSSAICAEHSQLLRVRGEDLRHFAEANPDTANLLLERLALVIAERLRHTHPQIMTLLEQGLHIDTSRLVSAEKHV
jgi:signal-transduction protein with cAMP-binding, CBS, and nucleotidyltransferase domain